MTATDEPWWARGLAPAERPGNGACPDWAGYVEAAGGGAEPDGGPGPSGTGLAMILRPFVAEALHRLSLPDGPLDVEEIRAGFADRLSVRLTALAARTLVLELHVLRVTGKLAGDTPELRFADFVRQASRPGWLASVCREYVVLARLLAQACLRAVDALEELLHRFVADRAVIVAEMLAGVDPGRLLDVQTGMGDGHHGGRSVAVLRFGAAAVVYKPRPLAVHRLFNEVVEWLNPQLGADALTTLTLVERSGYGWAEFVEHLPCATGEELARFYRRQGVLLALLYALEATDIHFENLIACGEQPVLVDVETLFHPAAAHRPASPDPALIALDSSVYRSALLPQLLLGEESALDVSGLGGDRGGEMPVRHAMWEGAGTDEMRLIRRAGVLAGGANRPTLEGREADPCAHVESLVAGFATGYRAVGRARHELAGSGGLLHRFTAQEVRVVARSTRVYTTLLHESTHPDLLRDAADRDRVLRTLDETSADDALLGLLVEHELAELWAGDVPFFTTRPGGVHLSTGHGELIPGALAESGLGRAVDKVLAMGEADRADQEWIIRAALATRTPTGHEALVSPATRQPNTTPDPEELLAAARCLADQMLARTLQGGDRINWLGLELLDDRIWHLGPLGAALGSGYTGSALFLAQLAEVTGTARYAEAALRALRPLPSLLTELADRTEDLRIIGPGGFAGLGGIAYGLEQVAALLGETELADAAALAIRLTGDVVGTDENPGVIRGTAGGLAVLLASYQQTGLASTWQAAAAGADRLTALPLPAEGGFSHGAAGVGWALLRFAAAGGGHRFEDAGLAALRYAQAQVTGTSWCRGLTGVALAVADSPLALADPDLAGVPARATGHVAGQGALANHSLCHGELGAVELLAHDGQLPAGRISTLLGQLDQQGPVCGTPGGVSSPGLLTGLAGIGHGLLRLGFGSRISSALLLQPPK